MSIWQMVADGIVFSSIIVLGSIGLSLVYAISDFPNFAHGDLMAVGAYAAFVVNVWWDVHLVGALVAAMAVGGAVAVATDRLVFRPLQGRAIELLITSIGVALCYRALLIIGFGSASRAYDVPRRGRIEWISETSGIAVTPRSVAIVAVTIVLVVSLHVLLQYTMLGKMMRATADNRDLARVSGIRTGTIITVMWLIGGALAAAGGVFLGLDLIIRPRMGFAILLVLFAAVILGGIGSVYGAVLGGFAIGIAYELTPLLPYVGSEYKAATAFTIMILILLVRPTGIVGGKTAA